MRNGAEIFIYGLTQLATNIGAALRLTGLIWIVASLLLYVTGYFMVGQPVGATGLRPNVEGQMPALTATFTMVGVVINVLAGAWIAMVWARFCLGADTTRGLAPSLRGQPFGGVLITCILVIAAVGALGFVLSFIGSLALPYMPLLIGLIAFPAITLLALLWLFFRIGSAIPASAAGQMLSLGQAWRGSGGRGLWLTALLGFLVIAMLAFPTALLSGLFIPGTIASIVASWLIVLLATGWLVAIFRQLPGRAE